MMTWQIMVRLIKYKPGLFLLNAFLTIIFYLLLLTPSLLIQSFFDSLSNNAQLNQNMLHPLTLLTLLVLSQIVRALQIFPSIYFDITLVYHFFSLISRNLFEQIFRKPASQALPYSAGEAINRFREDVPQITNFLSAGGLIDFIGALVFSIVAFGIMLSINWLITFVVVIPMVMVIIITRLFSNRITDYRRQNRRITGEVSGFIGEIFGAIAAIQIVGAQEAVINHFNLLSQQRRQAAVKDRVFTQFLNSISINLANFGVGLVLLLAAGLISSKNFTIGDFALFTFLLSQITGITRSLGSLIANYKQAGVSLQRLNELLQDKSPETLVGENKSGSKDRAVNTGSPDSASPVFVTNNNSSNNSNVSFTGLTAQNLTYHYPGSNRGIDQISFEITPGSFTVITGRIGSGKTTLLRCVLGLLPHESGKLLWNGKEVDDPASFFVPPNSSYTPQTPRLFSDSIKENILIGIPFDEKNLDEATYSAVLEQDLEIMEDGLETSIGPRGVKLSGGQVQRVAAARMFVRAPHLLVLDDISSALDVSTEAILWERLGKRKGITCLIVSNRATALKRADKIIVLKSGVIESQGSLEDLLVRSEEMRNIWKTVPDNP